MVSRQCFRLLPVHGQCWAQVVNLQWPASVTSLQSTCCIRMASSCRIGCKGLQHESGDMQCCRCNDRHTNADSMLLPASAQ
jgi:hypothetical protein